VSVGRKEKRGGADVGRMHEAPERAWTLEELVQKAGLSRAAFARNFTASVGEPPHSYLTRWRMGIAAGLLEETDLRLTEIAPRVGYRSEFSFSRAFKLARGVFADPVPPPSAESFMASADCFLKQDERVRRGAAGR